jgi:Fur family ferric uptake transcriptional regulator
MKKYRNTHINDEILNLLRSELSALSHFEIQEKISKCDRVTIYRVLGRLEERGLIHKIVTIDGTTKYAACHHSHEEISHIDNHVHFSCEKCKFVFCLHDVIPKLNMPINYIISQYNFTLSGICDKCISSV